MKSGIQFYDGITTAEIQEILIKSASDLIDLDHPNYQFVAARLLFALRKQLYGRMREFPSLSDHMSPNWHMMMFMIRTSSLSIQLKRLRRQKDSSIMIVIFCSHMLIYQVVDKYLVQDRSSGEVFETPQQMYIMIALTIFAEYPKDTRMSYVRGITMQSPSTESTSQRQSWQGSEHPFVNLHLVFSLMLMTPSIVSF